MSRVLGRTAAFFLCSVAVLFVSAFASGGAHATVGPCAALGNVEVEASGGTASAGYATLNAAFAAINAGTHTGTINIEVCGNTSEGATALLNASGSGSASYTSISIKPVGGASRTITGALALPLIDFNGADNVTIDGVNSGGDQLTISNTNTGTTSGTSTITFRADATSNVVTNASILGSFTGTPLTTNGGIIFFSTGTTTGNDNNTISNCSIGPAGATLPTKAIYGNGTTTTTALNNSGISITNNNIFDFFNATAASDGVFVSAGNTSWSITNNRFYQTATRTWTTGANHRPIDIQNTASAAGFTITGNTIGFAAANGTGTYALTGSTGKFAGIVFNGVTGGTVSNISSNTIASISLTGVTSSGTGTASPFIAVLVTTGVANTNSNVIGSQGTTGSITYSTTTATATEIYALYNFSSNSWTANSNSIGGIIGSNAGAANLGIQGLRADTLTSQTFTASSNLIGGTVADSIQNTSTATGSQVVGMTTLNAACTFTSNTIRNLTAAGGTGTTTGASAIGMSMTTTVTNHTLSQNTISNLRNTNAAGATTVTGIQYTSSTGTNLISRNFIHSLSVASATGVIHGIQVSGGTATYQNNMIDLGNGITTSAQINGINETSGTDNFYFNSVYIGGSPTAGAVNTLAFSSTVTTNTRNFRDNVFMNARSNSGTSTGKHYAIRVGGTAPNPAGLTSNNNVLYVTGAGGLTGLFNAIDQATIAAWRTATGQDTASFAADPAFLDPTGSSAIDLHIHPTNSSIAEGNGVAIGAVTDDFDGQLRASFTPTDIGADAGNFTGIDLTAPVIAYTALGNTTSTSDRTLTISVTDLSGVPTSGLGLPVLYFRKGTSGAYSASQCSSTGGNGYSCIVTYASVGGVVLGDTIQYYVAAQDTPGNVTTSPVTGGFMKRAWAPTRNFSAVLMKTWKARMARSATTPA